MHVGVHLITPRPEFLRSISHRPSSVPNFRDSCSEMLRLVLPVSATSLVQFSQTAVPSPERLAGDSCVTLLASVSPFRASCFDFNFGFQFCTSRPLSRALTLLVFGSRFPHFTSLAFSRFCDSHALSNLPRYHECGGLFSVLFFPYFEDVFLRPYRSPT